MHVARGGGREKTPPAVAEPVVAETAQRVGAILDRGRRHEVIEADEHDRDAAVPWGGLAPGDDREDPLLERLVACGARAHVVEVAP